MPEENGNSDRAALTSDRSAEALLPGEKAATIQRDFEPFHRKRRALWLLGGAATFFLLCSGA